MNVAWLKKVTKNTLLYFKSMTSVLCKFHQLLIIIRKQKLTGGVMYIGKVCKKVRNQKKDFIKKILLILYIVLCRPLYDFLEVLCKHLGQPAMLAFLFYSISSPGTTPAFIFASLMCNNSRALLNAGPLGSICCKHCFPSPNSMCKNAGIIKLISTKGVFATLYFPMTRSVLGGQSLRL